jgi:hypothetical protein
MDPNEELFKDELVVPELENHTDEIKPEEADKISGGGCAYGPYSGSYGS